MHVSKEKHLRSIFSFFKLHFGKPFQFSGPSTFLAAPLKFYELWGHFSTQNFHKGHFPGLS
jgi:hypothetical protein